jgi:O-antigen ligase/polysaccharide polymerase Wzy-like membrane protein
MPAGLRANAWRYTGERERGMPARYDFGVGVLDQARGTPLPVGDPAGVSDLHRRELTRRRSRVRSTRAPPIDRRASRLRNVPNAVAWPLRASEAALLSGTAVVFSYATIAQGAFSWPQESFFVASLLVLGFVAPSGAFRDLARGWMALGILAGGTMASVAWNGWSTASRPAFASIAAAVAALAIGRGFVLAGRRRFLLELFTAIGALEATVGLFAVAFHLYPWAMRAQGIWRLASSLTYSNAAASLLLLTLPASLLLLRERRGTASTRASIAAFLILTALFATASRAGGIAAGVMIACMSMFGARLLLRAAVRPALGAAIAGACFVPSMVSGARPDLAMGGIIVGALIAIPVGRVKSAPRLLAVATLSALVLVPVLALSGGYARMVSARVAPGSEDRVRTWSAAWNQALDHPVFGTGPGTFTLIERVDGQRERVDYAHNEFLQVFAETGAVGAAGLLTALVVLGAWARQIRPRGAHPTTTHERAVWGTGVAVCAAFAVHGSLDFVWHVPLLVAIAFGWLGVAVTRPPRARGGTS